MRCAGHYPGAQDTWTPVPFEEFLAVQGGGGAPSEDGQAGGLQGQMRGQARRLCALGWQHRQKVPPELYMSLKPSSWPGWLVTPWLVSALT